MPPSPGDASPSAGGMGGGSLTSVRSAPVSIFVPRTRNSSNYNLYFVPLIKIRNQTKLVVTNNDSMLLSIETKNHRISKSLGLVSKRWINVTMVLASVKRWQQRIVTNN